MDKVSTDLHMDPAVRQLVKVKAMLKTETKISDIEKEIDKCLNLIEARENYCIKMTTECSQELKVIAEMTSSHQWDNVQKEGHMKHGYGYNPVIMTGHLEGQTNDMALSSLSLQSNMSIKVT